MEAKSAFVRTDCSVELNSIATVYVDVSCIIDPRNTEMNQTFWFNDSFNDALVFRMLLNNRFEGFKDFPNGLMETLEK